MSPRPPARTPALVLLLRWLAWAGEADMLMVYLLDSTRPYEVPHKINEGEREKEMKIIASAQATVSTKV